MKKKDLLRLLQSNISAEEASDITSAAPTAVISRFNTATISELLATNPDSLDDSEVPEDRVRELNRMLTAYLERYMAEQPTGHKWIIMASLYQAMIRQLPIHPVEVVGAKVVTENGKVTYRCPAREEGPESICSFCVCRSAGQQ